MSYRCGQCKRRLVEKSASGGTNVRAQGKITIDEDGVCHAQCFFCKAEVTLPLVLEKAVVEPETRFTVDVTRVRRAPGS